MRHWLERLAVWYVERRGGVVLPFPFVGMAIGGNACAIRHTDGTFTVTLAHPRAQLIVLTGSVLVNEDAFGGSIVGTAGEDLKPGDVVRREGDKFVKATG